MTVAVTGPAGAPVLLGRAARHVAGLADELPVRAGRLRLGPAAT
ncbi:hypothetical protein [Micromonospora sp. RP3T]|nr:hypothetical protein [Micromonospora sp. RP3T]